MDTVRELVMDPTLPAWHPEKFRPIERRKRSTQLNWKNGKRAADVRARYLVTCAGISVVGLIFITSFATLVLR